MLEAQYNLGLSYATGEGVRQDYTKAFAWYRRAALQDHVDSQYALGWMYGNGIRQSATQAKRWQQMACDNGNEDGCD